MIAEGVIDIEAVGSACVAVGWWCIRITTRQTREGLIPATGIGGARKHVDHWAIGSGSAGTRGERLLVVDATKQGRDCEVVSEVTGVLANSDIATIGLRAAGTDTIVAGAVGSGVGVVNNPDFFLVVDRRQLEAMLVVRCEVELDQAIWLLGSEGGALVLVELVGRVVGGFDQTKNEELVLDDRAAAINVGAESGLGVGGLEQRVTLARGFRFIVLDVLASGAQRSRFPVHGDAALPFIGAALGGQTDHAAQ